MHKLTIALLASIAAAAATSQTITQFELPHPNSSPTRIAAGPDGALWFVETGSSTIGRITTSGQITEFAVGGGFLAAITAGPDGALWFTVEDQDEVGRMTTDGSVTRFPLPSRGVWPHSIVSGPDGALWFTERRSNHIGRITTDGRITEFSNLLADPMEPSWGIVSGPDGALWFTCEVGIGRITTDGQVSLFEGASTDAITVAGGALWFPKCHLFPTLACDLGRLTPDGTMSTLPLNTRSINGFNNDITAGPDGAIWMTERYANAIGRVTGAGEFTELPVPTSDSYPYGIAVGSDGALWFTEYNSNKIGRIGSGTPCGDPDSLCLRGGTYAVAASWTKPDGSSGTGHPMSMSDESGYFWFFEPGNVEVVVKLLDGCSLNEHAWFFGAGMTNLSVAITVRNVVTGETQNYSSPAGTSFVPIIDTTAFGCPPPP
jgi:virginiamycin B lyase